jgi:CheY-like chemotaxis protein
MREQQKILVVNAANYEEAIEQLKEKEFDHVITDAVLGVDTSGLDVLRLVRDNKHKSRVTVCHISDTSKIGDKTWNILLSLEVCFKFAVFYEGTSEEHVRQHCADWQQCA